MVEILLSCKPTTYRRHGVVSQDVDSKMLLLPGNQGNDLHGKQGSHHDGIVEFYGFDGIDSVPGPGRHKR